MVRLHVEVTTPGSERRLGRLQTKSLGRHAPGAAQHRLHSMRHFRIGDRAVIGHGGSLTDAAGSETLSSGSATQGDGPIASSVVCGLGRIYVTSGLPLIYCSLLIP